MESKKEKVKRAYRQKAIVQMIKDDNINLNKLSRPQQLLDALVKKRSAS